MRLLLNRSTDKEPVPAVEGRNAEVERPIGDLKEVAVGIAEANIEQLSQGRKIGFVGIVA